MLFLFQIVMEKSVVKDGTINWILYSRKLIGLSRKNGLCSYLSKNQKSPGARWLITFLAAPTIQSKTIGKNLKSLIMSLKCKKDLRTICEIIALYVKKKEMSRRKVIHSLTRYYSISFTKSKGNISTISLIQNFRKKPSSASSQLIKIMITLA